MRESNIMNQTEVCSVNGKFPSRRLRPEIIQPVAVRALHSWGGNSTQNLVPIRKRCPKVQGARHDASRGVHLKVQKTVVRLGPRHLGSPPICLAEEAILRKLVLYSDALEPLQWSNWQVGRIAATKRPLHRASPCRLRGTNFNNRAIRAQLFCFRFSSYMILLDVSVV